MEGGNVKSFNTKLKVQVKMFCDWFTFMAEKAGELKWQKQRRGNRMPTKQHNRDVEMKVMEKLDREIVLHSLSCSPKRAWPASNWEILGWRDFWRRAKSPVKKRKLQSLYVSQSQDLSQGKGLCELAHVMISLSVAVIKHVMCIQEGRMWLRCLSAVSTQ